MFNSIFLLLFATAMKKAAKKRATKQEVVKISAEEKIKTAARKVFTEKGFTATRTRDIAQEAGINLALLNYYFRSKEKLFEMVMMENLQQFMMGVGLIAHNENTSWQQKVEQLVAHYIDMLLANPNLPVFVMAEKAKNPEKLAQLINQRVDYLRSPFMQQIKQGIKDGEIIPVHPMHLLINTMGLIVFPFTAKDMLKALGGINQKQFEEMMMERKKLLPQWIINTMLIKKQK